MAERGKERHLPRSEAERLLVELLLWSGGRTADLPLFRRSRSAGRGTLQQGTTLSAAADDRRWPRLLLSPLLSAPDLDEP